jgi:hypothetical protein
MSFKKPSERDLLARVQPGSELLPPLVVLACRELDRNDPADARVKIGWRNQSTGFRFVVQAKPQSSALIVQTAVAQARSAAKNGEFPLIVVPYLSPERLADLERAEVSGVDLCGNGLIVVPGRLFVFRSGQPNRYPDSRPLNNPYRGRSAMVARMLLIRSSWPTLSALALATKEAGTELSLPQVSKAVQALEEDLIVAKTKGTITLKDRQRLLDRLGSEWREPLFRERQTLRLPLGTDVAKALSSDSQLKWAMTGESSVTRYAIFSQGGPRRVAVSDVSRAMTLLNGAPESIPNFADVELLETDEEGFFFANEIDENGFRWASRLQTWLELQSGDARQQDAARDLRNRLADETKT